MGIFGFLGSGGNKRIFLRLRAETLMRFCRLRGEGGNAEAKVANVKDVSEGGLMFVAYEQVPVSETVKVSFKLPGRENPVETFSKVCRCTKVSVKDEIYHVGVSFLDLNEEDRKDIVAYVEALANSKWGKELVVKPHWWKFWKRKRARKIQKLKDVFYSHEKPQQTL